MAELAFGFMVEGIGRGEKPILFTTDATERCASFYESLGATPVEGLLPRMGTVDTTIEPFRVEERFSNYQFRLAATDEIGKILFKRASRAISDVKTSIASVDSIINLGVDGLEPTGSGEVKPFYIDGETVLVNPFSPTSTNLYSVVRGAYGSEAAGHNAGANVFDATPYWIGRRAWFYSFVVGEDAPVLRDVLMVKSSFIQDNAEISIRLDSALGGLDKIRVNQNPAKLSTESNVSFLVDWMEPDTIYRPEGSGGTVEGIIQFEEGSHVLKKSTFANYASPEAIWVRIKNTPRYVYEGRISNSEEFFRPTPALDEGVLEPGFNIDAEVNEFLAISQYDKELLRPSSSTKAFVDLPRGEEVYIHHPLALCAALMLSTNGKNADPDNFDIFHPNYSLKLRAFFSDASIQSIHDLILSTDFIQIEQFSLGFDGQPFEVMGAIRNLLNTYGFRLGVDNEGFLKFMRVGLLDITGYEAAMENPITPLASALLNLNEGSGDATNVIQGTFGALPWAKGTPFSIYARDRFGEFPPIQQIHSDSMAIKADSISTESFGALRALMEARSQIQSVQMSRLQIRVDDYRVNDSDYSLGSYTRLNDLPLLNAWLWDSDGNRIKDLPESGAEWIGQIIGRRYLPMERAYEIEVIFTSAAIALWRAPSGIVENLSGRVVTLPTASSFGDLEGDMNRFTKWDQVQFHELDGSLQQAGVFQITDFTGGSNESAYLDTYPDAIPAGTVMELAHLDTTGGIGYDNPGLNGRFTHTGLVYSYPGDVDNELGTGQEPGSEYGG